MGCANRGKNLTPPGVGLPYKTRNYRGLRLGIAVMRLSPVAVAQLQTLTPPAPPRLRDYECLTSMIDIAVSDTISPRSRT